MPLDRVTIVMRKLGKEKLVKEFRDIRRRVKQKLSEREIDEEIRLARQEKGY